MSEATTPEPVFINPSSTEVLVTGPTSGLVKVSPYLPPGDKRRPGHTYEVIGEWYERHAKGGGGCLVPFREPPTKATQAVKSEAGDPANVGQASRAAVSGQGATGVAIPAAKAVDPEDEDLKIIREKGDADPEPAATDAAVVTEKGKPNKGKVSK